MLFITSILEKNNGAHSLDTKKEGEMDGKKDEMGLSNCRHFFNGFNRKKYDVLAEKFL